MFPEDPAASIDTDGDGYPDGWNEGMTESDSTTGLVLDAFPEDPKRWKEKDDEDENGINWTILMIAIISILIIMGILVFLFTKNRGKEYDEE